MKLRNIILLFFMISGLVTWTLLLLYSERNVRMFIEYLIMITSIMCLLFMLDYFMTEYEIKISRRK